MSKNNKPRTEIKLVTPEWAMEILDRHSKTQLDGTFKNRPMADRKIKMYAADMKAGNWGLTGQGISFDWDDNLMDGQHRLAAVVYAKVSVMMVIVYDLPPTMSNGLKTIDTFDIGTKRPLAGQLAIEGYGYTACVASAARLMIILARGTNAKGLPTSNPQGLSVANFMKPQLEKLIVLLSAGSPPPAKYSGKILAPLALYRTVDPDTADLFATEFNEMTNLSKTSPVLQFQKFVDRPTHLRGGTDYQVQTMLALASALFFYSADKKVEHIRGNMEHLDWLLKASHKTVARIRELAGITLTVEELRAHEAN